MTVTKQQVVQWLEQTAAILNDNKDEADPTQLADWRCRPRN